MAVSPKKLSQATVDPLSSNYYRLLITVVLCLVAYLISKPHRNSSKETDAIDHSTIWIGDRSESQLGFWDNPMEEEFLPHLVWLMSFPNSGTSYTMTTIEGTSNYSTASNYGDEVTPKDGFSLSIYPRHPDGPYWEGLSGKMGKIRHLPPKYVLVKTHCGSRCVKCPPSQYVESIQQFTDACRNSTGRVSPNRKRENYLYPIERVKKAIHLIRNPFHNFVARFHLERKNFENKKDKEWLEKHPNSQEGFKQWCKDLDNSYEDDEYQTFEYDLLKQMRLSPCHGEVFKYIQWHNMAFAVTENFAIETKVLLYEDFENSFEETIDALLELLEFPRIEHPREFAARHDYSEYYSSLDKRRIRMLVEVIATKKTWSHIEHYFEKN